MPTPVETILTSAGIPAEDVTRITTLSEEDQKTFDPKPYAEKIRANYQTQFQNDPAFFEGVTLEKLPAETAKQLEKTQFQRAANIMKDKFLKTLGMTEADLGDLSADQKEKLDSYIQFVTEKYTKTKTGDKQLQQDLIEARKKAEQYGPEYETKIKNQYESEANQKIGSAIFNAALIGELSTIPGLKIAAADIAKTANDILQSKYGFERVGDYNVELRQKANPQMKVLKENSSKELTLREALIDIAQERGWIEKEKESGKGSGVVTGVVTPSGKGTLSFVPPHIAGKISQKIAAES